LLVPEQDAEELIVDEFLDAFGDAAEEFVASEDRSEFAADVEEEGEGLMLLMRGDRGGLGAGRGTVALARRARGFELVVHGAVSRTR
jgi:hypothetical protein